MPSVVVIDDEVLVQRGLALILEQEADIDVLGTGDGTTALDLIGTRRPDVVLLDLKMPHPDGFAVLQALRDRSDPARVVVLTTLAASPEVERALRLGAVGYLLKDTDPEALGPHVRSVAAGGMLLTPTLGRGLAAMSVPSPAAELLTGLTDRERDVLRLLATGSTNNEIGGQLFLSVGTVKDHVSAILRKLGVATRVHAALLAERGGLVRDEDDR